MLPGLYEPFIYTNRVRLKYSRTYWVVFLKRKNRKLSHFLALLFSVLDSSVSWEFLQNILRRVHSKCAVRCLDRLLLSCVDFLSSSSSEFPMLAILTLVEEPGSSTMWLVEGFCILTNHCSSSSSCSCCIKRSSSFREIFSQSLEMKPDSSSCSLVKTRNATSEM